MFDQIWPKFSISKSHKSWSLISIVVNRFNIIRCYQPVFLKLNFLLIFLALYCTFIFLWSLQIERYDDFLVISGWIHLLEIFSWCRRMRWWPSAGEKLQSVEILPRRQPRCINPFCNCKLFGIEDRDPCSQPRPSKCRSRILYWFVHLSQKKWIDIISLKFLLVLILSKRFTDNGSDSSKIIRLS